MLLCLQDPLIAIQNDDQIQLFHKHSVYLGKYRLNTLAKPTVVCVISRENMNNHARPSPAGDENRFNCQMPSSLVNERKRPAKSLWPSVGFWILFVPYHGDRVRNQIKPIGTSINDNNDSRMLQSSSASHPNNATVPLCFSISWPAVEPGIYSSFGFELLPVASSTSSLYNRSKNSHVQMCCGESARRDGWGCSSRQNTDYEHTIRISCGKIGKWWTGPGKVWFNSKPTAFPLWFFSGAGGTFLPLCGSALLVQQKALFMRAHSSSIYPGCSGRRPSDVVQCVSWTRRGDSLSSTIEKLV